MSDKLLSAIEDYVEAKIAAATYRGGDGISEAMTVIRAEAKLRQALTALDDALAEAKS